MSLMHDLANDELGLFLFRRSIVELQDPTNTFKDKELEERYQIWKNARLRNGK